MLDNGRIVDKRYRIHRLLGSGGMGGVYLATHLELDLPVALKAIWCFSADPTEQKQVLTMFRREAQLLARLRHPGLPRVHDFFNDGQSYFLVMDYVPGQTLETFCSVPQSEAMVLGWAEELVDVLDYLHSHEPPIILRDVKPSNVILASSGRVCLIDFGIAKVFDRANARTCTLARMSGSPGYAAPEQYVSTGGSDARTDVYGLGATIYALLTGQQPPSALDRVATPGMLKPLRELRPDVSPRTEAAVAAMLGFRREHRPASMKIVRRLLGLQTEDVASPSQPSLALLDAPHLPQAPHAKVLPATPVVTALEQPAPWPRTPGWKFKKRG
ncbi:MAG TPA: serine/threonine-protein kinase [Candidatus Xenobia bacterium]|jgi:serine/threonine-protein kinase